MSMRVLGLVSGGKDSIFNLCHAAARGHTIVALASLRPPAAVGAFDPLVDVS